uniref:SBP-type domain-containing protein n=1 Tax=Kalanchoe fedtschenkoi TaxID=63787 RepID=A0A7N0T2I5_KALFE
MEPSSPKPQPLKPDSQSQILPQSESELASSSHRPKAAGMDLGFPAMEESESTTLFDWGDLLDFTVDEDQFALPSPSPFGSDEAPVAGFEESADRVRKRDPKLTCENFLAGRVPCACPEMDALLAEEEELRGTGKKRARTVRSAAAAGVVARCQVPGCEVDISELKGYHKRHRVCLKCANASTVALDGESKRYCQQCGKFHILSDFDDEKRSCRRKLERHNNRRRRKLTNAKGPTEDDIPGDPLVEEFCCDVEAGKAIETLTTKTTPDEALVRSEDVLIANTCSTFSSQDTRSDSPGSDETNMDGVKERSRYGPPSSNGDNKSAFSSVCPTGRISFKLYDWNPAEFPRRLRHQIFQWLASMPVELEGYIRPGCTILTVFLSMPKFMWVELFKDPASQLQDFISAPGRLLSGKGTIHVYLDDMRFLIARDGTFVKKVLTDVHAPKLHYVHPTFFEAGKPMEFVACGSNLLQQKFRFLVSFQEKYIANECYLPFSPGHSELESTCHFNHQTYKIYALLIDSDAFGPAFVEVENQCGLSNYIPVLIGDAEVCAEMERIQQTCVRSFISESSVCEPDNCEVYEAVHSAVSEFVLDIAWLLKKPASESLQDNLTSSQIKRYDSVLSHLLLNDSKVILDRVLKSLSIRISNAEKSSPGYATCEDGIRLLQKRMDQASNTLRLKRSGLTSPSKNSFSSDALENNIYSERTSAIHIDEEDTNSSPEHKSVPLEDSTRAQRSETVPLLCVDDSVKTKHMDKWPRQSCSAIISSTRIVPHTRTTFSLAAIALVCFGVCAVMIHPDKVGQFAVIVRRCLFDRS